MEQDAEFYFKRAKEKFQNQDIEGGFADLAEAIRVDPSNSNYYWERGLYRYEQAEWKNDVPIDTYLTQMQSQLELAISDFTRTLELTSDKGKQAEVYQKRVACYFFLNKCENLISDANWLIEQGFGDSKIYKLRGLCRSRLGYIEEALQDHTRASELSPNYESLFERAKIYYHTKRYREAVQDLTEVLNKSKFSSSVMVDVYQQRAFAYYRLGEFEASFHDFNEVQRFHGQPPFSDVNSYVESIKNLEAYIAETGNTSIGL